MTEAQMLQHLANLHTELARLEDALGVTRDRP